MSLGGPDHLGQSGRYGTCQWLIACSRSGSRSRKGLSDGALGGYLSRVPGLLAVLGGEYLTERGDSLYGRHTERRPGSSNLASCRPEFLDPKGP